MYTRKLLIVTCIVFIIILTFTGGCSNKRVNNHPKAVNGILDLTKWRFEEGPIRLDGQWEFYWNQLIEPRELLEFSGKKTTIQLPGSWNQILDNGEKLPGDGYATYRLTLITSDTGRLSFKMPRIFTAYTLWVNNEIIASAGEVGSSKDTMTPQYLPQVAFFQAEQGANEIVIQASNYYHRSGGILESLTLGSEKQILDLRYRNIAFELLLFGSIMVMGIYHLMLFVFRKKYLPSLYFGAFCVLVGVRTLFVGERFFIYLFPSLNWEIAHKIQTLGFYLGVPLIIMFFKSILTEDISIKIVRVVQGVGIAFAALVLFAPAKIFTTFNSLFQLFTVFTIMYIVTVFARKVKQKEPGIWFIVSGAIALFVTSVNDIVFLSTWMNDNSSPLMRFLFRTGNLSSVGQLVFIFTHSLLLAQKFSNALEKEEIVTVQLREMNLHLDDLVKKRTEALEESRRSVERQKVELEKANRELHLLSIKDPLTNLWNRRQLEETLQLEWKRGLRYKRPISLMIIDIDHFKAYNDSYGHEAGDKCLVRVAQAIHSALTRASDLVARYGGEEFVVIMPEAEKEGAVKTALFLRSVIEELSIVHKQSPVSAYVTVSIGVSSRVPDIDGSPNDLFNIADKALYQAKDNGRNQVVFLME